MATGQISFMMQQLRRAALLRDGEELSDGQLLDNYLLDRSEAAFETLVRRHGPMVLGVCRRALGPTPDAEDAFQAVFLVLVRKAASIRPRDLVGNWLYGVACRTALKAKATAARRRAREKQVSDMPAKEVHDAEIWRDLQPLLDQELRRLSANYRTAVVLCDLEGKSRRAAARQLGWPEGTLSTRLTRGRKILAQRLTRRGLALSAGALALALAQNTASASVPAPLVISTVKAATLTAAGQAATAVVTAKVAALTEGVLHAMFLTKVKTALALLLLVGLLATGAGLLGHRGFAGDAVASEPTPQAQPVSAPRRLADAVTAAEFGLAQRREVDFSGRGERQPEVQGLVKAVDASTITIMMGKGREAPPTEKTFALAKDVEVAVGNSTFGRGDVHKEGKVADLAAGVRVSLSLSPDEKHVHAILAVGPTEGGQVKAVDAGKKTVTLVRGKGRDPVAEATTYALAPNAEIVLNDGRGRRFSLKEGNLADVAPGAFVSAQLSLDGKTIESLVAEGPAYSGIIKAIDPAKKSLTLLVRQARGDDPGEEQALAVSDDATVLLDNGKGRRLSVKYCKLADIPVGAAATVKLSVDRTWVMALRAEGPTVTGLLKAVDPDKGIVVITIPKGREEGEEKSYTVAKDVRITLDGAAAKLDSLKVGENGPMLQLRLTLDQTAVQAIAAYEARRR
jgi:RNA polymerase sigma factor (sigma-70 family)